jgi:hypothetical protein
MLAGPDNTNSLRAALAGTAPMLDRLPSNPQLTDRLLARTGVLGALSMQLDTLRAGLSGSDTTAAEATSAVATRLSCGPPNVTDPAALDRCMGLQYAAAFELASMKSTRSALGVAFGLAGLVPGAGTAAWAAGSLLFLHTAVLTGTAKLLPSHFIDGGFDLTTQTYLEDQPGPDHWENAWVRAESNGWALEQLVLKTILQILGTVKAYNGYITSFMEDTADDVVRSILEFIEVQLANEAIGATSGSDIIQIDPEQTPRVFIDDDAWSSQRLNGSAIALTGHATYEPRDVGEAQLIVATEPDSFPHAHHEMSRFVEVEQITVDVNPPEAVADPGQVVDFTATVNNAVDPTIAAEVSAGAVAGVGTSGSTHDLEVTTPTNRDDFPVLLTVEAVSSSGARQYSSERRVGQATLYLSGSITVQPQDACVPTDSTRQYTATVHGLDDTEVRWSASAGSITSDGLFTAPSGEGTVTVTATSAVDSTVHGSAEALVEYSCDDYWTATIDGTSYTGGWFAITRDTTPDEPIVGLTAASRHDDRFVRDIGLTPSSQYYPDIPAGMVEVVVQNAAAFVDDYRTGTSVRAPDYVNYVCIYPDGTDTIAEYSVPHMSYSVTEEDGQTIVEASGEVLVVYPDTAYEPYSDEPNGCELTDYTPRAVPFTFRAVCVGPGCEPSCILPCSAQLMPAEGAAHPSEPRRTRER